jgi:7,8-dihydro-6-hydroxymethylpterin-pyrophosphokinase
VAALQNLLDVTDMLFSYLEDPRDIANARRVCKSLNKAGKNVTSVCYVVRETRRKENACVRAKDGYIENAYERAKRSDIWNCKSRTAASEKGLDHTGCTEQPMKRIIMPTRQVVEHDLRSKPWIRQLRIEIEAKLQSESVRWKRSQQTDLWLSDPGHLFKWVPSAGKTLQHLCIVDYGQRAIMYRPSILEILSRFCKILKTLDLSNMCINTKWCEQMPELTSFVLHSVEMNGDAFDDISDKMGKLQTLDLRRVSGILTGRLSSPKLKVLCLGLSTKAGAVKLDLPSLSKLQLKMVCPEELCITAPALKFIAFNLKVPKCSEIEFKVIPHLQALLFETAKGKTAKFLDLSILLKGNSPSNKVELNIPCLRLDEDGEWLGVLKEVGLNIPTLLTKAGAFKLDLPSLGKFRMICHTTEAYPNELCITASALKLGEPRLEKVPKCSEIEFKVIPHLQALLYGTPRLLDLSILLKGNSPLNKVELDIPCLRLGEDRKWLGVLEEVVLRLLTKAGAVKLDLPSLAKFRMICHPTEAHPNELCITASALKLG